MKLLKNFKQFSQHKHIVLFKEEMLNQVGHDNINQEITGSFGLTPSG